jgi:hypothetical protein
MRSQYLYLYTRQFFIVADFCACWNQYRVPLKKLMSALFLIYVYLYFNITEVNTLLVFKGECHYYIIIKLMLRVITVGKGYYFN